MIKLKDYLDGEQPKHLYHAETQLNSLFYATLEEDIYFFCLGKGYILLRGSVEEVRRRVGFVSTASTREKITDDHVEFLKYAELLKRKSLTMSPEESMSLLLLRFSENFKGAVRELTTLELIQLAYPT